MMTLNDTPNATPTDGGFDMDAITGALGGVFNFLRTIIDFLKGIFKPLIESLLGSVIGGIGGGDGDGEAA